MRKPVDTANISAGPFADSLYEFVDVSTAVVLAKLRHRYIAASVFALMYFVPLCGNGPAAALDSEYDTKAAFVAGWR